MAWTLERIAAAVAQLNDPNEPIRYEMNGAQIVAHWDVAHVAFAVLLGGGAIDKEYALTVDLNTEKEQYSFEERKDDGEKHGSIGTDGSISFGGSASTFRGKQKSFSWGAGAGTHVEGGDSAHSYSYEFEDSRVKGPLFGLLEQAGYEQKKGFLGGLFG
ncbi:hypothetical protein [Compostimonas suwonensis]|uniref:Uncharacterized protein n=1 Tax=Compostimonas suwonensis TaxID=1048394 RepID=A0A2M9C0G1_9MICO|nr:hypothetical protein [Compostimonas suwonensis]PJJ63837.1 hypothetical protein CLV54_1513 [Compostimonas suwonensis]